jgi:phasin
MDRNTPTQAAKEAYDNMSATATETADLVTTSYSTAFQSVQDYNNKVLEFANQNMKATFDFAQRLAGVKTPSEFVSLSTEHAQMQLTTMAEQAKQLASLVQKVIAATAGPVTRSLFAGLGAAGVTAVAPGRAGLDGGA